MDKYWVCCLSVVVICFVAQISYAEVVEDVNSCWNNVERPYPDKILDQLMKLPPNVQSEKFDNVNRYVCILQKYRSQTVRFVTLFDKKSKIPAYSIYRVDGNGRGWNRPPWMNEPLLVNKNLTEDHLRKVLEALKNNNSKKKKYNIRSLDDLKCMQNRKEILDVLHSANIKEEDIMEYQAVDSDFIGHGYRLDRGHLNPVAHHNNQIDAYATMTYTNVVPQYANFNRYIWYNCVESKIREFTNKMCKGTGVGIVGAVPSTGKEMKLLNGTINIPRYMYAAVVCPTNDHTKFHGFIGDNIAGCLKNETESYETFFTCIHKLYSGNTKPCAQTNTASTEKDVGYTFESGQQRTNEGPSQTRKRPHVDHSKECLC